MTNDPCLFRIYTLLMRLFMQKKSLLSLLCLFFLVAGQAKTRSEKPFALKQGEKVTLWVSEQEENVVHRAIEMLQRDMKLVLQAEVKVQKEKANLSPNKQQGKTAQQRCIWVMTLGSYPTKEGEDVGKLRGKKEAFMLKVQEDGSLLIIGTDKRGTAYGVLELSRLLGVSPWEWWADATPNKRKTFFLPAKYVNTQSPTVEYRGIFLNDEDWGLLPWSNQTYEPNENKKHIGPKTYGRIFELMLRLRANTLWPAMHECTLPFFMTEGNREAAANYGIFIGSSHCEPMVCNAAGEWSRRGKGEYDYVNNQAEVFKFWKKRIKEVAEQDNIYTLGMRGVHDGKMQGAKTLAEQKSVLTKVIADQRKMLANYVSEDVSSIPQAFIPYKEVLDIYNTGLEVPEEVTLMWCDDNYGYIRHFPTEKERTRKGGNGIYYHISYWGRPHDYLWLNTLHPALAFQQMNEAYERGIQKMWIINVGDIKPGEYLLELLMDMAWNLDEVKQMGVKAHNRNFWIREFGKEVGDSLAEIMQAYYRLNYIRRPEFLGNTRTEERNPAWKRIKDLPWSEKYLRKRLTEWNNLSNQVETIFACLPQSKQESFFQLVKYPVQGAAQMNNKLLYAQLARHCKADWEWSDRAYDSIASLTDTYNKGIGKQGKWKAMMDFRPRRLPVFNRIAHDTVSEPMLPQSRPLVKWNATECSSGKTLPCEGLGYEEKAAQIAQGSSVSFESNVLEGDSIDAILIFVPRHPVADAAQLRVAVTWNEESPKLLSYETKGRSEEWKENILWNRAVRSIRLPLKGEATNRLTITALDEGIILDQIFIFPKNGCLYPHAAD